MRGLILSLLLAAPAAADTAAVVRDHVRPGYAAFASAAEALAAAKSCDPDTLNPLFHQAFDA